MNADDPAQVSVDYSSEPGLATPGRDYTPAAGTLTFVNGGPSELSFPLETFDDNKYEGDERVILRLSNPVDVAPGFIMQASATIVDDETYDSALLDDFELGAYMFEGTGGVQISTVEVPAGDPLSLPDQGSYETILKVVDPVEVEIDIQEPLKCNRGRGVVPIAILTTDGFDALTVDHATVTFNGGGEIQISKLTGEPIRREVDVDGDGDLDLLIYFRLSGMGPQCENIQGTLEGLTFDGQLITSDQTTPGFGRDLPLGEDWSIADGLSFWYYGQNTGDPITVMLKDNRAPDPGPSGWSLVWNDEFSDPEGTPPNPAHWGYELGDGTVNGIPGWGNDELQYYTDSTENAATDGKGNLVITAAEADGTLPCYYGSCEYTSARLISANKAEFAYGRIETRILVPQGAGLWPAFWSLGTDIGEVGWPQTGEIDIMEFVGREPFEVFGTIHGPGYSGGSSYGDTYTFRKPVYLTYHTFAVEWSPDEISWYVDGINYHNASPADVAPNEWVFNHPFYILLNVAVGGNFGGPVGDDTVFPQKMLVDYVRVYQGPDTAERFESQFVDDFNGWQRVEVPFASLVRSADQPDGAPDDGLTLTEVWGYGFSLPDDDNRTVYLDQVRLEIIPPPTEITVTNLNDSGSGSLREALELIANGGTITFDPALAGGTITLTSGQLTIDSGVTVDASAAAPLTISGGGSSRVIQVGAGVVVDINDIIIRDGVAAPQGGGILNRGVLSLNRVVVTDNVQNAAGPPSFDLGGGGIYNADSSTLNLTDSTVSDNSSTNQPGGGIYGFFNSNVNITNSTVSGNFSGDVAGGLRMLSNANIVNSTFSGNISTAWHGGGIFHTDGNLTVLNSTFTGNIAPAGTASGILVATFGAPASMTLTNSVMEGNGGAFACAIEGGGAATITSGGFNVISDGSCNPIASDQSFTDALLGPLADNGGPTLTHALLAGSAAIDMANAAVCPATDQRGVLRPQGAGCDVGSFEYDGP